MQDPKRLYIIGNGFDRHHGINSSYKDFKVWLEGNDKEFYDEFQEALQSDGSEDWWLNFEKHLGDIAVVPLCRQISFEHSPDLLSEHFERTLQEASLEVERYLNNIYDGLRTRFHDWIIQLNLPLIDRQIDLNAENALFLSFNYTKTLEEMYGISPNAILHIHGCINDNEEFIIGHGLSSSALHNRNRNVATQPSEGLTEDEYEEWVSENEIEFHEKLAQGVAFAKVGSYKKPVEKLINDNSQFFNTLSDVNEVYVYGFSFSTIDRPYLNEVAHKAPNADWIISFKKDKKGAEGYNDYINCRRRVHYFLKSHKIESFNFIELNDIIVKNLKY